MGSGFIVSADGFILTNSHVVEAADEITVRLTDKREFKAKVIGADKRTDVALIKIEATGLPAVKLGDPHQTKVGEWVVAIGSPFGFDNSGDGGNRFRQGAFPAPGEFRAFIQTDVAINPGNSGGPLFNLRGEVIGINSQIYSRSGGFMGLSFAIPIDVAMEVQNQLRSQGKVSRGRLGVVIQEVSKGTGRVPGPGQSHGRHRQRGGEGQSGGKGRPRAGDVILKFDGKASTLPPICRASSPPPSREANRRSRSGARAEPRTSPSRWVKSRKSSRSPARQSRGGKSGEQSANRLGLVVSELSAEQKRELKVAGGLFIEDVRGSTSRADLRPGDIILALISKGATTEIKSAEQFNKLLAQFDKTANVTLLIRRGEMQTFVTIKGLNGG